MTKKEYLELYQKGDLYELGQEAHKIKEKLHGKKYYYTINKHINYTNICSINCKFCAYKKRPDEAGAYVLDVEEVVKKIEREVGLREVHIVGGVNPVLPYEYYVKLIKRVKEANPSLRIKAFTCVEIDHLSRISGKQVEEVLLELKEAGLSSLPGGGAEVFSERVRKELYPAKISHRRWLEIAKTAHKLEIKTNATLLFGHIETDEEIIDHLLELRQAQEETGGFEAFVPLPFIPNNTPLAHLRPPSAQKILRTIAISRIILDNIPHIKAYWVFLGMGLAQTALLWGADHIHGTVIEERISEAMKGETTTGLSVEEIQHQVKEVGGEPVLL